MNRGLRKFSSTILGLFVVLIFCSLSCRPRTAPVVQKMGANQFVAEDLFLSITNGSTVAGVRKMLGSAVRHEFTVVENGHSWMLIKCFLHTGEQESYSFYQLLFCDDALVKTIGWIPTEREEYPYEGTTATRFKPWDIEDLKYVKKAMDAPVITPEQIRRDLEEAQAIMNKFSNGQGNIPAAVIVHYAQPLSQKANKEFPINEELRQRFNGCKAAIGMTIEQVDTCYGQPLRAFTTKTGRMARIYGDHRYLGGVDHFLMFSYVAVLFDAQEKVSNIYSDGFFCADWDPNMPEGRRN
jgi:hypothetical protein